MDRGDLANQFKAGITDLVLENYKRKQIGLDIIPLIFCYDIEGNQFQVNPETITSRNESFKKLYTNMELRRCYKICCEKDPELKIMTDIAKETIKFVKLVINTNREYELELLKP
jgi:hypothetical protein